MKQPRLGPGGATDAHGGARFLQRRCTVDAKAPARPRGDEFERVSPASLSELMHASRPPLILDVRKPEDFLGDVGHIDGASLFPLDQLDESLPELEGYKARGFVLVCEDGQLAARAAKLMSGAGFTALKVLAGGMQAWLADGLPVRR